MRSNVSILLESVTSGITMRALQLVSPGMSAKLLAKKIQQEIGFAEQPEPLGFLLIPEYSGNNATAIAIQNYLISRSHPAIKAAFIQGSVATGEEQNYSDFDGILMIDVGALNNLYSIESLIHIIRHTNQLMLQQDALQHHGWNILTTSELNVYPDDVLPLVLLEYGKTLFPKKDIEINYSFSNSCNYSNGLLHLCNSLQRKSGNNTPSLSFRHFKTWMSEILLLPAVYIQAKTGKPIFKKESFEVIGNYLSGTDVKIILQYSALRNAWNQDEVKAEKELSYLRWRGLGKMADALSTPLPERYKHYCSQEKREEIRMLAARLAASIH